MFEESARYSERGEIDAYCRHLIYMVGLLARLDELTIQLNIQRAFAFADEHPLPFGLY
jgi:hypothetical protein